MKSKCSSILKTSVALVLAALVLFGSLSTVLAATVDMLGTGANTIQICYDVASGHDGNWDLSNKVNLTASGNEYATNLTLNANTKYYFFIKKGNDYYKATHTISEDGAYTLSNYGSNNYGNSGDKCNFTTSSATKYTITWEDTDNRLIISPTSSTVSFTYDVASGHDSNWDLDNKVTMTSTSTDVYTCDVVLNAQKYYLFAKVGSYWYRGTSELTTSSAQRLYSYGNSNYGDSGDKVNFTPSTAGTYRFTWNHKYKTISVEKVTYNVKKSESGASGGAVKLGSTTLTTSNQAMNPGSYTLSITAPNGYNVSAVSVSGGSLTTAGTTGSNTYSGTVNVTAATTVSVTYTAASNPAASSVSLSRSPSSGTIYAGVTSVTYTASATGAVSGATYNFKVDGTSVQNTTSTTYTTTFDSAGTKSVTVTVQKSGYDDKVSSANSTEVSSLPSIIYDIYPEGSNTSVGGTMTYDATASAAKSGHLVYKFEKTGLSSSTAYYVRIWDGSSNYRPTSEVTTDKPLSGTGVSGEVNSESKKFTTNTSATTGKYEFYYDHTDHKFYFQYPHKVTFSANGHGTAPSAQTINYGGKVTKPTDPTATGWVFGGWYKESGCTNAWNFSTDTVTATTTLYAKWTLNPHNITYPSGTGYTVAGTKPATAGYGDTVSFTVTPASGYRISAVKYTPSGGSATDCTAGSNNEYHFTMPDKDVSITVTAVKTYTVTLSASGTGMGSTKQYFVGTTPDTYSNYSSAITVDAGSTVYFKVNYETGYEYNTVTNATVYTANTVFKTAAINANTTVTITAKKISYSVSVDAKYSTNGTTFATDFLSASKPAVSIGAASATQLDGTTVSAPATDPNGYVFVGWATNTGSTTQFGNQLNKDTTFKPTSGNTQAIARYKKIFTITSSVDSTGTGAGTVSTSVATVVAGGSYTITATPATKSAIESVKVNGTSKGTNASTTVSSVSADQTVVVKFKSTVYLRGDSTIGGNWSPGHEMTSNAAGTEFTKSYENVAGASGGTTYEFKLHNGEYSNDGSATINITGSSGTGTCTHQSSGNQNYVLTLKQACNVTIKSDGNKITEIKVVPANATKYAVTFKKATDTTITGSYEGTNFTTASADAVVQVYSGDDISFTVTPASGKFINNLTTSVGSLTPAFSNTYSNGYEGKLTNVTSARTVTPAAASKVSISAKTNKSARGTVSVDKSTAAPGDKITITVTPKNGVLKSITYTYAGETTAQTPAKKSGGAAGTGMAALFDKINLAATGANLDDLAATGEAEDYEFTLSQAKNVTVNATFDAYSAESDWYYNGYDTSGNAVSGYHGKQMTEGVISGEKFSYYHVTDRTGTDQLMTVSNGAASSGTRYIYFTPSNNGGWSTDENHQYAYFYNGSGDAGNAWPGYKMTKYTTNDYGESVYRVEIPTSSSPTGVIFNNNEYDHQTTNVTDLSKGGYYLLTTHYPENGHETHDWQSYDCTYPSAGYSSGTEYFYGSNNDESSIYSTNSSGNSIFNTTGFYRHGVVDTNYAKPRLSDSNSGDYYVNVLYPGKTYTINGMTNTIGSNPVVIWSTEPLVGEEETVTVYAKDGAIRSEAYGSTYANIADTKIYEANGTTHAGIGHTGNITNQTWETYRPSKGDTIVIKTQIGATDSGTLTDAATLKAKYYVRGFCINGEVTELLEWNADGLYTLTYKIPEDIEDGAKIEITPIYYLKDTTNNKIVTYRVTGFTDELKQVGSGKPNWGDTLYTYPFYGKLGSNNNALGAYPGQPMVYYKGQYQMQIPQKSTAWDIYYDDSALSGYSGNSAKAEAVANTNVSGVTMSNGYFDIVHRQIMGYGDNSASADHVQTYDYGDFFKIFNEKAPVDNIVFDFKYETKKHNFENQPASHVTKSTLDNNYGTNGNGFELLTNFHGRSVDLFGTALSGDAADPSKTTPVYVVSIGGVNGSAGVENIAGYYATEWMVYGSADGTSYDRITGGGKSSIPPEVLVLNDDDATSFNSTTYPSADASHTINDWKDLYSALETYRGKPVMITYEAADAQIGSGNYATSGGGGATRNDGRWLYSKNGETITSKIKIQYSTDNGTNYIDLNTTTPQVPGLSAYFTNSEVEEGATSFTTTIDPDKTFDFEAKTTNPSYKFVGWFMEDGTKITSDNASHTERSGSYNFVAKFMEVSSGQLTISHTVDTDSTFKGAGTVSVSAIVYNENDEIVRSYAAANSITMDEKVIKSDNRDYKVVVTLTQAPSGYDTFGKTTCEQNGTTFLNPNPTISSYNTKEITFHLSDIYDSSNTTHQNVLAIMYHTYYTKTEFTYEFTYSYNGRLAANEQSYKRTGTLTAAQVKAYVSGATATLDKAFPISLAPHESNFNETLIWSINSDITVDNNNKFTASYTATTYTGSPVIEGEKLRSTSRSATFDKGDGTPTFLVNCTYGELIKNSGAYIVASETYNGSKFAYWKIETAESDPSKRTEVARCYNTQFNYIAYDNYYITAIYDNNFVYGEDGASTSIHYLDTTRNQWNDNGNGGYTINIAARDTASDILFNDFALSYGYNGERLFENNGQVNGKDVEVGFIVEKVQKMDILKQDGTIDTDVSKYIPTDSTAINTAKTAAETAIRNISISDHGAQTGTGTYKDYTKYKLDRTMLDNKNRIEFYYALYNAYNMGTDGSSGTKLAAKNYVYRAYSYIKVGDDYTITDNPAYFIMYDEATK